jgi:hypothetical protein
MAFHQLSIEDAIAEGKAAIDRADTNASVDWKFAAYRWVEMRPVFSTFMAEDMIEALTEWGITTHENRAAGSIIQKAARAGLIRRVGYAPARTSHGSAKSVWERLP